MAARHGQKVKLLYIIKILRELSDENHPLSASDICKILVDYGITAERKAIYDDIDCLMNFGYDIIITRTPKTGYFLASREFEMPEIFLLCDAVKTAKFISSKKTRELTGKLYSISSKYQRSCAEKGVYFNSGSKTKNENIFYNIDIISEAIQSGVKITLNYGNKVLEDNREVKIKYKHRKVSPYAMTWQDDCYYLICNYEKYDNLMHLRIDRMKDVEITTESARHFSEVSEYKDIFNVSDYTAKLFGMFGGELSEIKLRCSRKILEQINEKFGNDIFIRDLSETHFTFSAKAAISNALVTFIMNYGPDIQVLSPNSLKDMIKEKAKQIYNMY